MSIERMRDVTLTGALDRTSFDAGLRAHMVRVFNTMAGGVALTGAVAWMVANTPLYGLIFGSPLVFLLMLSPLAFMLYLNFRIDRVSAAKAKAIFWAFSAVMGVSMASIFVIWQGESVARAFFVTAATFAAMALWGYTTKRDLTGFGAFLMMGVFGIFIAMVVNLVLGLMGSGSSLLQWAVSVIGVVVFTGLTAWDTQNIKQMYAEHWGAEANDKMAVMGALRLYLNFINAFQFLLSLMGDRR